MAKILQNWLPERMYQFIFLRWLRDQLFIYSSTIYSLQNKTSLVCLLKNGNLIFMETCLNTGKVECCFTCLIGYLYASPREWFINTIYSISYWDGYPFTYWFVGDLIVRQFPLSDHFQRWILWLCWLNVLLFCYLL